uniref:Pre-mRNA splicing Prp18-interacting factor n=1 Tax=Tanacetum cinerariifolium TaxID=118510 RepID=A0A6L2NVL9_TANCI|nr:hypothetical protein [Tanacetum cinerariifolium]
MMPFDYRLNPLYPIKECSSCGALYTTDYCCSEWILRDKIIYDLDKTPDLSQRSPQNCPKCRNPVKGHYCQGCALLRKKFKKYLFTSCIENRIFPDPSEPSNNNTNVANALRGPFVVTQDPGKNSSQSPPQINHHCCYGCGDPLKDIFCHQCTCELCGNGAHYGYNCSPKVLIVTNPESFNNQTIEELPPTVPSFDQTCYSEDGNSFTYDFISNLVHDSPNVFDPPSGKKQIKEEQAANTRYWKILVCYDDDDDDYNFAITPKEPDNSLSENECDVPACEVFTTFSNILFDADNDFYSSDDQSFSDEDIPKEIYSNPLFDEKIISMKIDPHHFNAESNLIESLLNHDSSIISSSSKIDSLLDEFAGELTLLKSIPSGINEIDCDPNDPLMEEIDLSFTLNYPMPPGIEEDDYDSERDILILEEFLSNDGNTGILNVKMMGDISKQKVPMPRLMFTQSTIVSNQEKSSDLLPHQGHEAFQPSAECPMMIHGRNTHILDAPLFHFYPP